MFRELTLSFFIVTVYSHGAVFGVWSANASVGNIIGAFLVSELNM